MGSPIARLVRQHPLPAFFVLAFALSWWGWPLYAAGRSPVPIASFGPFLAAVLLLLALPAAVLGRVLFGANSETVVHPVAAAALAAIFALQALGMVLPDETLHAFAFQVLGNHPERLALDALLACFRAVCLLESQGATRIFGLLTLLTTVAAEVYLTSLQLAGAPANAGLRLLYPPPLVWLLLESRKARALEAPAWEAQGV